MKLIRYKYPQFSSVDSLNRFLDLDLPAFGRMGSLFSDFLSVENSNPYSEGEDVNVDWFENDQAYRVNLELPGVSKAGIEVQAENGVLTISADRKVDDSDEKQALKRRLVLPDQVDVSKVGARFENGVLSVDLPKEAKVAPISIKIK